MNADPLNVNARLYNQIAALLDELEAKPKKGGSPIGIRERIAALIAIGRIQTIFVGLRKESGSGRNAGSSVRKYASAFKDANRGRKASGRRAAVAAADDDFEPDDGTGDDAA